MKKVILSALLMLFAIAGPTMANNAIEPVNQPDLNSLSIEIPITLSSEIDCDCTVTEEFGLKCTAVGEAVAIWFKRNTDASYRERRQFAREARALCNLLQDAGLILQK